MMFVIAVILLLLASFTFFLGANMLKVCYSIAEDPPNGLPSYELYTKVTGDALTIMTHVQMFTGHVWYLNFFSILSEFLFDCTGCR